MKLSASDIEESIVTILKGLNLGLGGGIYRRGARPYNSNKEDCIVALLSGVGQQLQKGYVVINIYVSDVKMTDGQYHKNMTRCAQLETLLGDIDKRLNENGEIRFDNYDIIATYEEVEINQHFVSAKLQYRYMTDY